MEMRTKEIQNIHNQLLETNKSIADLKATLDSTMETALAKFTTDALPTLFAQIREETQRQLNATLAARDQQPPHPQARLPTQPRDHKLRLLFPRFASGDPTDWIFNVEQYFQYYATHPADRLLIMSMHLDSPASRWYQGLLAEIGRAHV